MQYAVSDVNHHDRYKILTAFVLPRPIAWVTTLGPTGTVNAAPFSFFNVFAEDPPLVMFAVNKRPDGRIKDTWTNIERTGQFVVNLTDEPLARAMHDSSGDFPPDIGEPDYLGLELVPSVDIKPPRLAEATIYSDVRERVVSFPAVDKGSVVELEYTRTTQATPDAPMGGEQMLGEWDPILERIVTTIVPES